MRVVCRNIRPLTVLYVRSMGPYLQGTQEAWKVMGRWLDGQNVRRHMRVSYGLFHDNPRTTAPELLRYDACIPLVAELDLEAAADLRRQTFGGGAYAVYAHVGSYEGTGEIFSKLHREIVPTLGLTVDYGRPFLATYLNDPMVTRAMHRRTELCVPLIPLQMSLASNDEGDAFTSVAMVG